MSSAKTYKIGVVENEDKYRNYIIEILNSLPQVAWTCSWPGAEQFWRDNKKNDIDLLFLDINLNGMDGTELLGLFKEKNSVIKIVMLSNIQNDEIVIDSLKAGADGFILKSELENISEVIDTTMSGGAVITPTIALRVFNSFRNQKDIEDLPKLTMRERQSLELLVTGASIKQVAAVMKISDNTLRNHIRNIYKKMNVRNKIEMMHRARDMGIF